ncbi:MAG: alkaline phosphatase family protein [Acidobacteriota bacterium]
MRRRARTAPAMALILTAVAQGTSQGAPVESENPRLLLFLTIDQARYDYLVRFRGLFEGGLKLLLDEGVVFTDAHQNHAITSTAPGHAALATGLYPSHSGMINNRWYDRASQSRMYSVQDSASAVLRAESLYTDAATENASSGRSPRNLLATTLADWIKEQNPESKAYSAGGKDRAAITMGGKSSDAVLWYDLRTGQFVTSRYYMKEYPPWLEAFHERRIPDSHFGKAWEPLPVAPSAYKACGIEKLDQGVFDWSLPHPLGSSQFTPDSSFYSAFYNSPYLDAYLVELAKTLMAHESLGKDSALDFLALAFSTVDTVGHAYGPNSPEVLDAVLRLDRALGELFRFVDETVGMEHVAVALSADHGVMPLPEYLRKRNLEGRRFATEDILCFQGAERKLDQTFGEDDWLLRELYINYEAIGRHNVRRQEVEETLARFIEKCPGVEKVWTRTSLESSSGEEDPFREMFLRSFHPHRSPDLLIQLKPFHISRLGRSTTHGSPYPYDTHVPLIVRFPGVPPAVISERIDTVDLAPTLASLLEVRAPGGLDGVDRSPLLRWGGHGAKD